MRKILTLIVTLLTPAFGLLAETAQERLRDSAEVFHDIMSTPDKGIPQDLLAKAACVVIVPGMKKGALIVGAQYGKGFTICRREHQGWGAPAAVRVEGGSFGFQIGGSSTDVIMLIMSDSGMRKLDRDKFTLGADASVAAGPVGRTAAADTDAYMSAEILSWSRAKGLFAGIALKGATLRPDMDDNKELYGQRLNSKEILMTAMAPPEAAHPLIAELDRYSMRKEG
ncbi:MAG TPA: lipid-binding SYLF domain-containing protein [Bryobacteraceae bacterium]|nr:lipid-binding SYLF domain-containing protein [Bryobacteraceae bacterium]